MNIEQFEAQVASARPGRQIIYHSGHLAFDRLKERAARGISDIAFTAMILEARGLVLLVQKRNGENDCDYIAVRTKKKDR